MPICSRACSRFCIKFSLSLRLCVLGPCTVMRTSLQTFRWDRLKILTQESQESLSTEILFVVAAISNIRIGEASLTSHIHNPVRICTPSTLNVQFHILSLHALHTLPLCPLYLHQRSFSPMPELLYSHQLLTGWDNEVYKINFLAGKLFLLIIFHMSVHSWTILEKRKTTNKI